MPKASFAGNSSASSRRRFQLGRIARLKRYAGAHLFHRQVQPGSFLLGKLRSCRYSLFRPAGPAFIRGACLICRIVLRERPIRTRSPARASGLATISCLTPRSTSYAYPEPEGFASAPISPAEAFYNDDLSEYVLPYDSVARADDPERALMKFLTSPYEAAASLGKWDRAALECRVSRA